MPTATWWCAATSRTSCGFSTAAVPITTRSTPASSSASADAWSRTPPPAWTWTAAPVAAAIAAMTGRFSGVPVRAASRSTRWTHRAPAAAKPWATVTGSVP